MGSRGFDLRLITRAIAECPSFAPPSNLHPTPATTHVPFRRRAEKGRKGEGMGGRHEGQEGERPHLVLVVDIRREGP